MHAARGGVETQNGLDLAVVPSLQAGPHLLLALHPPLSMTSSLMFRLHTIWLIVGFAPLWTRADELPKHRLAPPNQGSSRVASPRTVVGTLERRRNQLTGETSFSLRDRQTGVRYRVYCDDHATLQPFLGRRVRMRGRGWHRSDIDVGYLWVGDETPPHHEGLPAAEVAQAEYSEPYESLEDPQTLPAGWVSRNRQSPVAIQTPATQLSEESGVLGSLEIPTPVGTPLHDLDLLDNPSHRCPQCGSLPDYACGPAGSTWARGEYLYWRSDGLSAPALLTTGPAATPAAQAGVLDQPGTQTLIGNQDLLDENRGGARVRIGLWLGPARVWGLEGDYLILDDLQQVVAHDSGLNGVDILAQPFFNINPLDALGNPETPREDANLLAYPQLADGAVELRTATALRGASLHLVRFLGCRDFPQETTCGPGCGYYSRVDLLLGFQFMQLEEQLSMVSQTLPLASLERRAVTDRFQTDNDFQGGEIGFHWQAQRHVWTFDLLGRVAVGNVHQLVDIAGQTVVTDASGTETLADGGMFAQRTNSGQHERDALGLIPQAQATVGVFLTPHLRATLGYSLIYWNNVVRPTEHIDSDLNPLLLPPETVPFSGAERPAFAFDQQDFWAQGFHAGVDYRW